MRSYRAFRRTVIELAAAVALSAALAPAWARTRVLYVAKDGTVMVGRSMDWGEDLRSNNSISRVSKYGSLIVSGYDIGTSEAMNEAGLIANLLALVESDYGKPPAGAKVISMSTWAHFVLDNHATVAEAVAELQKGEFRMQTIVLATGRPANMHLAISDATGDSAIFEYVNGTLVIHHGKQYKVLTNSPTYDQQLAIMEYWKDAGGLSKSLPGTSRAADHFVRATFLADAIPVEASPKYIGGSPQQKFQHQAAMSVLSVMRSVGTPLGYSLDDQPGSRRPFGEP